LHPYFPYYTPRGFNNRPRLDKIWQIICYNHSLNWFQRAPICMKKTNIQGVSILLMATHFFHFRNFFIYFIYIFSFVYFDLSLFASLPFERNIHFQSSVLFSQPKFQIRTPEWLGIFSSRSVLYKIQKLFYEKNKKGDFFFQQKSVNTKISQQNYDVIK